MGQSKFRPEASANTAFDLVNFGMPKYYCAGIVIFAPAKSGWLISDTNHVAEAIRILLLIGGHFDERRETGRRGNGSHDG